MQAGRAYNDALAHDAEQLKRIHSDVDKIEENLNFADRTIRGMESIWGSVKNMVARPASAVRTSIAESTKLDKASSARQSAGAGAGTSIFGRQSKPAAAQQAKQQKTYGDDWQVGCCIISRRFSPFCLFWT